MFGTLRALKFRQYLEKKLKAEPFNCWIALEELIRSVREDTVGEASARSESLLNLIETYVRKDSPQELIVSIEVKQMLLDLYDRVTLNPEFWDGRPLMILQSEAAKMFHDELKLFFFSNPWTEIDKSIGAMGGHLAVKIKTMKEAESQRAQILKAAKKHDKNSLLKSVQSSKESLEEEYNTQQGRKFSRTKKKAWSVHFCKLTLDCIVVYGSVEKKTEETVDEENIVCLAQLMDCSVFGYAECNIFEVRIEGYAIFFGAGDLITFSNWFELINANITRKKKTIQLLEQKQRNILSVPPVFNDRVRREKAVQNLLRFVESVKSGDDGVPNDLSSGEIGEATYDSIVPKVSKYDKISEENLVSLSSVSLVSEENCEIVKEKEEDEDDEEEEDSSDESALMQDHYKEDRPIPAGYNTMPSMVSPEIVSMAAKAKQEKREVAKKRVVERKKNLNTVFQECVSMLRYLDDLIGVTVEELRLKTYMQLICIAVDFVASAVR